MKAQAMAGKESGSQYLACEGFLTYGLLIAVGGWLGAFTYTLRGGVFCNAQTGNFVLLSMALGNARWSEAAYYIIPITAYMAGAFVSELLFERMHRRNRLRWETALVGAEMLVVFLLGLVPDSAPSQISQVAINFICSMQYNTFRQLRGVPMATTFCTNHIRQVGVNLAKCVCGRGDEGRRRMLTHAGMLCAFVAGGAASAVLCRLAGGKAVWGAGVLLAVVFGSLLYADLKKERALHDRLPGGH